MIGSVFSADFKNKLFYNNSILAKRNETLQQINDLYDQEAQRLGEDEVLQNRSTFVLTFLLITTVVLKAKFVKSFK